MIRALTTAYRLKQLLVSKEIKILVQLQWDVEGTILVCFKCTEPPAFEMCLVQTQGY
jgi:hypothetical protein